MAIFGDYRIMPRGKFKTGLNEVQVGLVAPPEAHQALIRLIAEQHPAPWKFDPKHAYEQTEFWEVFYGCLSKLKDTMGQAFTLKELEGLSTEEICKELNLKPNNLWVVLHRARTQLKSCLEDNWTKT